MYNEKLVVAVKASGRVLREHKDSVYVPFGAEYSLFFKNLNSVRVLIHLEIDGTNMTDSGIIVDPGESVDLERSIKNSNLKAGNRFKFIERTSGIESGPRGIKPEDGLIRVQFEFEKQREPWPINYGYLKSSGSRSFPAGDVYASTASFTGTTDGGMTSNATLIGSNSAYASSDAGYLLRSKKTSMPIAKSASVNNVGITVPGSVSNQAFTYAAPLVSDGIKHVIVLRLLGETMGVTVPAPVTVKSKPKCVTCGVVNKAGSKFCSACGTSLTII